MKPYGSMVRGARESWPEWLAGSPIERVAGVLSCSFLKGLMVPLLIAVAICFIGRERSFPERYRLE